jgi:hypothetical protein
LLAFSHKVQKSAKGMKASGGNGSISDPNQPSGPAALLFIFTALSRSCHCVKGFQALTWRGFGKASTSASTALNAASKLSSGRCHMQRQ